MLLIIGTYKFVPNSIVHCVVITDLKATYIYTSTGWRLMLVGGYTFSRMTKNSPHWKCSSKSKTGCKARISLNEKGDQVIRSYLEHIHPPPKYMKTATGLYVKV